MKKIITILVAITIFSVESVFAQTPQAFKYQAIARDNSGNVLANQNVSFRISILQGSTAGSSNYTETQTATTNQFGLANLNIGNGTVVSGNFSTINWSSDTYFVKMEFDPAGGSSFTLMGTSQLLSVPYSLYSKNAGSSLTDHDTSATNELQTLTQSGTNVTLSKGGGTISVNDGDASPTNELQTLTQTGTNVTLSNGGGTISVNDGDTTYWKKNGNDIYYNSGKIGIGTTTPSDPLNIVSGNSSTTIGPSGIGSSIISTTNLATGVQIDLTASINGAGWVGTRSNHPLKIQTNNNVRMTIDTSGNVGIGTSNTTGYKMRINGNGINIFGDPTPSLTLNPSVGATKTGILFQTSDQFMMGASGGSTIFGMDLNAPSNAMKIISNGNIGIGGPPTVALHVLRSSGSSTIIAEQSTAGIQVGLTASAGFNTGIMGTISNHSFQIQTNNNVKTTFLTTGQVGIGIANPASQLTVSGGDVEIRDIGSGIIMKSPNGSCWRVTLDNTGALIRTAITCP